MAAILTGLVASWMSRRLQLVALGLACVAMLAVLLRVAVLMDTSKLLAWELNANRYAENWPPRG